MKQLHILCLTFCSLLSFASYAKSTHEYRQEFENFKNSPRYEAIFNENAPRGMSNLQARIETGKELSVFQRFVRNIFFLLEPVTINATTMPKLYSYADTICKNQHITTPTIFITRDITAKQGMFNAMAQKLLMSSGAIVIGQKMLLEASDAELEAVIAHELGHITYNHVNKQILLAYISIIPARFLINWFADGKKWSDFEKAFYSGFLASKISSLIIGKRFEKQADEFAYKVVGKGEGCIELFEDLKNRKQNYDDYYTKTYEILQESKKDLDLFDTVYLTTSYYLKNLNHEINNLYIWLYHNTPMGAHPSPEARIQAVKDYLESQKQATTKSHA